MFKNVASKFVVFAFDATTNVPKTGDAANITAYVSKDYGTVTVLGDTSATEMDATNAPGYYLFDAAQAETNGDELMVSGKSSTANIKVIGAPAIIYTRPTTGWLAPTVAARTLDVSAGGEAGVDWANVGSPTTSLALTGTTIANTQKVDVDTIKTNAVVNGGTVTFPANKTLASTDNITAATGVDITKILGTAISTPATAGILDVNTKNMNNVAATPITTIKAVQGLAVDGVIPTATNLTNAPTNGDLTATMKTSVENAVLNADMTGHQTQGSLGQAIGDPVANTNTIYKAVVTDTLNGTVGVDTTVILSNTAAATIGNAVWTDITPSDFTVAASVGKSVMNGVALGTGLKVNTLTNAPTVGDFTAVMKTSIGTAVAASAVASVTGNVGGSVASVTGAVGSVTAPVSIAASQLFVKKNVQLVGFMFKMVLSSDGSPATGKTVVCQRSINGAAFANCTNTPATEISGGWYKITLEAADVNGALIAFKATEATCKQTDLLIVTQA